MRIRIRINAVLFQLISTWCPKNTRGRWSGLFVWVTKWQLVHRLKIVIMLSCNKKNQCHKVTLTSSVTAYCSTIKRDPWLPQSKLIQNTKRCGFLGVKISTPPLLMLEYVPTAVINAHHCSVVFRCSAHPNRFQLQESLIYCTMIFIIRDLELKRV